LKASRKEAAARFAPKSDEEDLLASLFGGVSVGCEAAGRPALGGVVQALGGGGGMGRLAALVESGEAGGVREPPFFRAGRGGEGERRGRGGGGARGAGRWRGVGKGGGGVP
jgi:hypothetical protein